MCDCSFWSGAVLANWATVAGAIIASFGLGGILIQLIINRRQAKRIRTYEFSEKYQSSFYYDHMLQARRYLENNNQSEDEKWDQYDNNKIPDIRKSIYTCFAYFEDLALMYNMDLIDKDMIKRLLKTTILTYYELSMWMIVRIRKKYNNNNIYKEWQDLYEALKNN